MDGTLPVHLYHRRVRPGAGMGLLCVVVLAYTFAGFGVFWLRTGQTTIGSEGYTFTTIGTIVWIAPIFLWFPVYLAGDRGPFARLWLKRGTIDMTATGIAWSDPCDGKGQLSWDDLARVSELNAGIATLTSVFDREGRTIAMLHGDFRRSESRRWVHVPTAVATVQPGIFIPVDPRHPERGCVRHEFSGGPSRSAP